MITRWPWSYRCGNNLVIRKASWNDDWQIYERLCDVDGVYYHELVSRERFESVAEAKKLLASLQLI